jgi:hypothetical protein
MNNYGVNEITRNEFKRYSMGFGVTRFQTELNKQGVDENCR